MKTVREQIKYRVEGDISPKIMASVSFSVWVEVRGGVLVPVVAAARAELPLQILGAIKGQK